MALKEQFTKTAGKILNKSIENNGLFLFVTAAASWCLASTAQAIGLVFNKDISKEDKKFLVPQEILDGTFNIATFAAVTLPLMKLAGDVADKKFNNKIATEGAKTLASVAGGIISSNIITPLLRNKTGSIVKDKMEKTKGEPISPVVYNNKSYPFFKAKNMPSSLQSYKNSVRTMPLGNLKI